MAGFFQGLQNLIQGGESALGINTTGHGSVYNAVQNQISPTTQYIQQHVGQPITQEFRSGVGFVQHLPQQVEKSPTFIAIKQAVGPAPSQTSTGQTLTPSIQAFKTNPVTNFAKNVGQGILRSVPAIADTVAHPLTPHSLVPTGKSAQNLYGKEPIRNLAAAIDKNAPMLQSHGVPGVVAYPLAAAGFLAGTVGNFTGLGEDVPAVRSAADVIAKSTNPGEIASVLDNTGIKATPEVIKSLVEANTPKQVTKIIGQHMVDTGQLVKGANGKWQQVVHGESVGTPTTSPTTPSEPLMLKAATPTNSTSITPEALTPRVTETQGRAQLTGQAAITPTAKLNLVAPKSPLIINPVTNQPNKLTLSQGLNKAYAEPAQAGAKVIKNGFPSTPRGATLNAPASLALKDVAASARNNRFAFNQQIDQMAKVATDSVSRGVAPTEQRLFKQAVEHPEQLNSILPQVKNPQGFSKAVNTTANFFKDSLALRNQHSTTPIGEVTNYFPHNWDLSKPEDLQAYDQLLKNFRGSYTKQRLFNDITQGEAAGFRPKNDLAAQDIIDYANQVKKSTGADIVTNTIEQGGYGKHIKDSPLRGQNGAPYKQLQVPGMEGTFVSQELHPHLQSLEPGNLVKNPILRTIDNTQQMIKRTSLALGAFHDLNITPRYIGAKVGNFQNPIEGLVKGRIAMFSPKYMENLEQAALKDGTIKAASEMSVVLGRGADVESSVGNGLNPIKGYEKAVFQRLIKTYALDMVRGAVNKGIDPASAEGQKVGAVINSVLGDLNYETLNRNPDSQFILRQLFLAPGFNEGKLRTFFSAFKGGAEGNYARGAILGSVLVTALGVVIANKLINDKYPKDVKDFLVNDVISPSIGLPSQFNTPAGNPTVAKVPGSTISDLYNLITDPKHNILSRTSPLLSLAFKAITGEDYYGQPISDPYASGNKTINNIISSAKSELPIPVVQGLKVQGGKEGISTAVGNTLGLRIVTDPNSPTMQYFTARDQAVAQMTPNQAALYQVLHPDTKTQTGAPIPSNTAFKTQTGAQIYLTNPDLLALDTKLNQIDPNHDPFFDLSPDRQKQVLLVQTTTGPVKSQDVKSVYNQPWYQQFQVARNTFYTNLAAKKVATGSSPQPTTLQNLETSIQSSNTSLTPAQTSTEAKRITLGLSPTAPSSSKYTPSAKGPNLKKGALRTSHTGSVYVRARKGSLLKLPSSAKVKLPTVPTLKTIQPHVKLTRVPTLRSLVPRGANRGRTVSLRTRGGRASARSLGA